jgi:radical SAM superfamily enzyme YgiQ (UPF0313 family)
MGTMYLSGALKRRGHEVALIHASDGSSAVEGRVAAFKPDVIAYSIMTGEHPKMLSLNRELKARHSFLAVFGGPHPTFFPAFIEENSCDAVCVGEGGRVFPEFCDRLQSGGNYWETPNFIVKHEGRVFANEVMPLIEDLDDLPSPDRDLVYAQDAHIKEDSCHIFFSSWGCPFQCTYCFNNRYNELYRGKGRTVRYHSPERIIEDILAVKSKYRMSMVYFVDDLFLSKPAAWFDTFCELYKRKVGLPFSFHARANLVSAGVLAKLKDAGLSLVWMGVECGDEKIANELLKRSLTNAQIISAAGIIKGLGIKLITQNLTGLPLADSYEVDLKTLDLNLRIRPDFAWAAVLYPYPGTPISEYAMKQGFLKPEGPVPLDTNKRYTSLNFSPAEKSRIENLHKLFGVAVNFPWLRRHLDTLTRLPLSALYLFIFYAWYGYCVRVKLRDDTSLFKEVLRHAGLLLRILRQT